MGFAKLREWVGTVTGKGVRWGRDRLGRSEPALMAASTTVLPPTYLHGERPTSSAAAVVFAAKPANCGPFVGCEACAGRRIRWLCCLQLPCSAGFCLPPLPAMPTALLNSCPRQVCLPPSIPPCFASFAPFIFVSFAPVHPCAPGSSVRASSLLGPADCQGQQFVRASGLSGPAVCCDQQFASYETAP